LWEFKKERKRKGKVIEKDREKDEERRGKKSRECEEERRNKEKRTKGD
jgi:hypothetical protein